MTADFDFDDDGSGTPPPPPKGMPLALSQGDREGHDKSDWGDGPWQHEPDRVEWLFAGVPCLILRHPLWGSLNGYAGVEAGHKWHSCERAEVECDAHGGITFCGPADETLRMLTHPGAFMNVWWLGFDCGHAFDVQPGLRAKLKAYSAVSALFDDEGVLAATYRDLTYVTTITNLIAKQIIDARR